ncbi:hypothetical protein M8J76_010127 [Diaphorina citri]|nr:hypothetical protein M8J75_008340 [Diaphorina citri]KAI5714042.1 hypothetical protein M8J76_010127 [Diaphorina citri]KAI5716021.1 hypothetical protein M8J77_026206 [Diaphorina citri]
MTLIDQLNLDDYVAELESELSARYTDQDPDYTQTETSLLSGDYNEPPILAPWRAWEPRTNHNNARNDARGRHTNQERYRNDAHSNAENRRYGNRYENDRRPHHAKPYDRPYPPRRHFDGNRSQEDTRYRSQDDNRYNRSEEESNRYRSQDETNRYNRSEEDSNRYANRSYGDSEDSNRYGNRSYGDRNRYRSQDNRYRTDDRYNRDGNRYERGGRSRYDRRPGTEVGGQEEERRYGHYHATKREIIPDDSEWT